MNCITTIYFIFFFCGKYFSENVLSIIEYSVQLKILVNLKMTLKKI